MARTMPLDKPRFFIDKAGFLKRAGYALITVALILLTFLNATPEFRVPTVAFYAYLLLGVGGIMILTFKSAEIIQQARLSKRRVYCLECGWFGHGEDWYRYRCCPECDSKDVVLM